VHMSCRPSFCSFLILGPNLFDNQFSML
jgi:hypothetical protein